MGNLKKGVEKVDKKSRIEWKTEKRKIKDLIPHPRNPRKISQKSKEELIQSLNEFNYVELVAVNIDNIILAGHQRIYVMQELGRGEEEIEVRVPSRSLSEKEIDKYLIASNKVSGDWDHDIISSLWSEEEFQEMGYGDFEAFSRPETLEEPEIDVSELDKKYETFSNATIKQIVLYYPNEIYEKAIAQLDEIAKKTDCEDNSEVVLRLISFWEFNNKNE